MPASFLKDLASLEESIKHVFDDKGLAAEALTHKSYSHEDQDNDHPHNERLEFLGDAILGAVISSHLFNLFNKYSEAMLSKMRSYVVQESTLAEVAQNLNIGRYLLLGKGEESSGGRKKPSLLANAFEALVAAVYLDGGIDKASDFILNSIGTKITEHADKGLIVDFKTRLQEVTQSRFSLLPVYRVTMEKGPEHEKVFEVTLLVNDKTLGKGIGRTKKAAEQMAAQESLKKIENRHNQS